MNSKEETILRVQELVSTTLNIGVWECEPDFPLMGGADPIDSMALVEICVQLEDLAALIGFDFDWTSSKALSKSGSVFKSVGTLTEEFLRQMNEHAE